jgi:hypothetical protein
MFRVPCCLSLLLLQMMLLLLLLLRQLLLLRLVRVTLSGLLQLSCRASI